MFLFKQLLIESFAKCYKIVLTFIIVMFFFLKKLDHACQSLNGMKLGDKTLLVQRANLGAKAQQDAMAGLPSSPLASPTAAGLLNLQIPAATLLSGLMLGQGMMTGECTHHTTSFHIHIYIYIHIFLHTYIYIYAYFYTLSQLLWPFLKNSIYIYTL